MSDFNHLANNHPSKNMQTVFDMIEKIEPQQTSINDSVGLRLIDTGTISKIKQAQHAAVVESYGNDNVFPIKFSELVEQDAKRSVRVLDSYFNSSSGIGTGSDPGFYNQASVPFVLTPDEATSYYASGGLPQKIIDKKVKGVLLNGFKFKSRTWKRETIEELEIYAEKVGLSQALEDGIRDGCIYGGALIVPAFKNDNPVSYGMSLEQLLKSGTLDKDCIDYLWTADRWNTVLVPDYNISAKDYITPPRFFVPLAGLTVNTERLAIIRPKILPFWGTLRQTGWGVSELEGWIRAVSAYEILIATVPIMAQQMSLIYHHIPLDGLIAMNGPEYAREFAQANSAELKNWSMLNPKTINSIGEIKSIERSFSDFDKLVSSLQEKISADCGLAQSELFNREAGAFSDNSGDMVKKSEEIQTLARTIARQLKNITKILVVSCFGKNSPEYKNIDEIELTFESPNVLSDEQKSNMGVKFANIAAQMWNMGMDAQTAVKIASTFVSGVEIPDDIMEKISDEVEEPEGLAGNEKKPIKEPEHERAFGPKQSLGAATKQ